MPPVRTLVQIPQLSDFERGRILEIARRIGRIRCCQAWTPEGREQARGTGRRRMTTRSIKGCLPFFVT
jgi:hypothetical protein